MKNIGFNHRDLGKAAVGAICVLLIGSGCAPLSGNGGKEVRKDNYSVYSAEDCGSWHLKRHNAKARAEATDGVACRARSMGDKGREPRGAYDGGPGNEIDFNHRVDCIHGDIYIPPYSNLPSAAHRGDAGSGSSH